MVATGCVGHEDFGTIVDLGCSPGSGQEEESLLKKGYIFTQGGIEAVHIVVIAKNDQVVGARIEEVLGQHAVQAHEPAFPGIFFFLEQGIAQAFLDRKIHEAAQVGHIPIGVYFAALPERYQGRQTGPFFPYHVEMGVFFHDAAGPFGHETLVWIGVGIHADTV